MSSPHPSSPPSPSAVQRLAVIGGSGFVGSAVCREALKRGLTVTSINRSGPPRSPTDREWVTRVHWVRGDVLDSQGEWRASLQQQDAVISAVGGFGSIEWMRRINGDATINAARAADEAGVRRFGFVSAHHYSLPALLKKGYFEGKLAAEREIQQRFSGAVRLGVIAEPSFIYGPRRLRSLGLTVPLQCIGAPLQFVTHYTKPLLSLPLIGAVLAPVLTPPVAVQSVARALLDTITDGNATGVKSLRVDDIHRHDQN